MEGDLGSAKVGSYGIERAVELELGIGEVDPGEEMQEEVAKVVFGGLPDQARNGGVFEQTVSIAMTLFEMGKLAPWSENRRKKRT